MTPAVPETLRAVELERAVLAACLVADDRPGVARRAAAFLLPIDFTDPALRAVFGAAAALVARNDPVDAGTLATELRAMRADPAPRTWAEIFGAITAATESALHLERHMRLVRERTLLRAVHGVGVGLVRATEAGVSDAPDFLLRVRGAVAESVRSLDPDPDRSTWAAQVDAEVERLDPSMQRSLPPVPTGFAAVDAAHGGWSRGNRITLIAGWEGSGKSALALSSLLRAARAGSHVAYLSLEEPRSVVIHRLLSNLGSVENSRFATPLVLDAAERAAYIGAGTVLRALPMHVIASRSSATGGDIRRECEALRDEYGPLDVVVVDNASRLRARDRRYDKRHEELAVALTELNGLAKDHECAVVVLSHVGRAAGSGGWRALERHDILYGGEREAGTVILLDRNPTDTHPDGSGRVRLNFDKVNEARSGVVWLAFEARYVRFVDDTYT